VALANWFSISFPQISLHGIWNHSTSTRDVPRNFQQVLALEHQPTRYTVLLLPDLVSYSLAHFHHYFLWMNYFYLRCSQFFTGSVASHTSLWKVLEALMWSVMGNFRLLADFRLLVIFCSPWWDHVASRGPTCTCGYWYWPETLYTCTPLSDYLVADLAIRWER
jgi:hypothetical protein